MLNRILKLGKPVGTRVHTPTILQMEAVECGAAALAIILQYYGRIVPLEQLRQECGVSRDGSKASNIVKAARKYGLSATGLRTEPNRLKNKQFPLIVFWNFNHFVVVEGFKNGKVYINDPASGPRIITEEEFDLSFTGVVLEFKLTDTFEAGGTKPNLFTALRSRVNGSKTGISFVVLASLFLVIPGLLVSALTQVFVDDLLISDTISLEPIAFSMLAIAMLILILTWLQQTYLLRTETRLALTSSSHFFWHILHLPVTFFSQRFAGDIVSRIQINDKVAVVLSRDLATNILGIITATFYAVLMIQYDVLLTFIGVFIAFFNLFALNYFSQKRKDINQRLLQDRSKLTGATMNGLQMIETLKSTGSESDFFAEWAGYFAKSMNAEQELGWISKLLSLVPTLLTALNTTAILVIGSLRIINGEMTIGMLIAFQALVVGFLVPITNLVNLGSTLQEVEGDMVRLDDVLLNDYDAVFNEQYNNMDIRISKLNGYLEIKNLTFGYNLLEKPLLENFNLTLKPGQRVALVGASGSGKSTVAKLIAGLYQPWEGEILFDGEPLIEIPRDIFSSSVALVDQQILLMEGTIRDNLTLWDSTIPHQQIVQAAKDAAIDDVIAKRGGYDNMIAENGRNFSGGQRQRLDIARALTVKPSILVLDEATSALDPITEKKISDSIRLRGCTTIIVAHRLSTIRDADEIIVMEKGKVIQRGTHEELYKY